jgi:hypothetical protein
MVPIPHAQGQITTEECPHPEKQVRQPAMAVTSREEKKWKGSRLNRR